MIDSYGVDGGFFSAVADGVLGEVGVAYIDDLYTFARGIIDEPFFWSNGKGGQEGQAGASDQLTDDEFSVADGQIGTDRLFSGSQVAVQHQTIAGIPLGQNKGMG